MLDKRNLGARWRHFLSFAGVLAVLGFGGAASAESPGWDSTLPDPPKAWDPRALQQLPKESDQKLDGLPNHVFVKSAAVYSFGTALGPDNSVYFTEFGKARVQRLRPDDRQEVILEPQGGAYGIAVNRDGDVFVGADSDQKNGGILRLRPDGKKEFVVQGLTRPRQLACTPQGDLYFITEGENKICRWSATTGKVDDVLTGLGTPQGLAVAPDGSLYFSEYGSMGPRGVALKPGTLKVRRPNGSVEQVATGFWRARGIALAPSGDIFITSEANAWDQGNSGALAKVSPDGKTEFVLQGLDYPQVPAVDASGNVYFSICRENLLLAYMPGTSFAEAKWKGPDGLVAGIAGGTVSDDGTPLPLKVGTLALDGKIRAASPGQPVYLWFKIPANALSLDRNPLPYPSSRTTLPGMFDLPETTCPAAGAKTYVLPLRGHVRSRWPVYHDAKGTELAAEGFSESPESYLVFVECRP